MRVKGDAPPWWRRLDPLPWAFVVGALVIWGARGLDAPLPRDAGLYLYAGQQVAGGDPPYVGVLNRAGPISHLLPALGVELGRLLGAGDVVGVKVLYLALMSAAPALVYLIGRDVFGSRLAGVTAGAALLSVHVVAIGATNGPEAKLPVMLAQVIALLLLTRRRWLGAGVVTALATLTWQPVLFCLAPAAAVRALTQPASMRHRARDLSTFAVGGLVTLGVIVAGFWAVGALDAFVEGFWTVNATYTEQTGAFSRPRLVLSYLQSGLGWTLWPVLVGCALSIGLGVAAMFTYRSEPRRSSNVMTLGMATAAFVAWCGVAFNRGPDGLPAYPLAALGLGGSIGILAHLVRRAGTPLPRRLLIGTVALWVAACTVLTFVHTTDRRSDDLEYQRALTLAVFSHLPDDATVFTYEATPPMVLSHSTSISRFVLFGHGMLDYVAAEWPGGVDGYVHWLIDERPDVVFIHIRNPHDFLLPLLSSYTKVSGGPRLGGNPEWRTYVRNDLDPEIVAAIKQDHVTARRAQEAGH
ncbi:hypothetical protein [Nocardioides sp.]|uniref:hypothetical protein n=1 Tax=Nocardioides sp. TaxID=35761 RepID=UPI002ED3A5FF